MTDKQINYEQNSVIIDGVDVRGCKNFRPDADTSEISYTNACSIGLWQRWYSNLEPSCTMSCRCRDNPDCHYKLYKRKEQECEELKSVRDSWISRCEQEIKIRELYQDGLNQLKAKEQECERLKLDLIEAKAHSDYLNNLALSETLNLVSEQLDKYKQTLTEIKELMRKHCRKCKKHKFYHFKLCCTCKYTDILQKINECEVEDDR